MFGLSRYRLYQILADQHPDRCDESDNGVDAGECSDGLQPACNYHRQLSTQGDVDIFYRNPSKNKFNFSEMLVATNPILLWLFKHGWEDPGWGQDDASQISILSALHALADQISDTELRAQVKKLSSKGLAKVANRMAGAR